MRIHLHTLCWNDRATVDYFFRHYESWIDRFYIFDDGSDDGTREYLEARSDVVLGRTVHSDPDSWVLSAKSIYDNDWKRSVGEADWVVITNFDEHLHHPSMRDYLADALVQGFTAIPALGYQMISVEPPAPGATLWRDCPMGAPWLNMSKLQILRPDQITATNFAPGRHRVQLSGNVSIPIRDDVLNLHYKYMGGAAETHVRHSAQAARLGSGDRLRNWGHKYRWSREQLDEDFAKFRNALVDTTKVDHHTFHPEQRWWREPGSLVGKE